LNWLSQEFSVVAASLPFPYDLERVIDDWVFLCYLVGEPSSHSPSSFVPSPRHTHPTHL
jgi:5'-3' exonuclease